MRLSAAEDALREVKPEVALGVLLEAWREKRHPRLSELIERLSNQLTAAKGPLTAKTVGQLHEAALALHAKKEPAELGRLLQVQWPGTWQKGLPLLEAILKWPEDPRIDAAMAGLLAEPPYDSMASRSFFAVVNRGIDRVSDTRVIPTLESAQSREQPWWYTQDLMRSRVDVALKRLRGLDVTLDEETSSALERIESYFAESKAREKDKSRGEAELVADIYARPNDLQARAVFADWLTERGDPRGELITLQLAPSRTRQQETRLNALLKASGSDWAGPLDEWFEKEPRYFEAGFLIGGRFPDRMPRTPEEAAKNPGWRLIRKIELSRYLQNVDALLEVAPLEELHGLNGDLFERIALHLPTHSIRELSLDPWVFDRGVPEQFDDEFTGLPHLKTLGLKAHRSVIEWMKRGKIFKQLQRLRISAGLVKEVLTQVRAELPNITEVELMESTPDSWLEPQDWRLTFRRVGPGEFTELEGSWGSGGRFSIYGLIGLMELADVKAIKKIELRSSRTLKLKAEELKYVEEALSKFSNATITVPWEREAPRKPAKQVRTGPIFVLHLKGDTFLQPEMEPLWKHLGALGLQFDSYGVGYGSAHRSLGPKPGVTLSKWGKNPRCHDLKLYEDGTEEELWLERPRREGFDAGTRLRFHWAGEVEPFLTWIEGLLDGWSIEEGTGWIGDNRSSTLISDSGPDGGWITIFGPKHLRFLPEKEVQAILTRFPGSFLRKTKRNLIIGAAKSPNDPHPLAALGQRLNELVVNEFTRAHGIDFLKVSHDTLAPAAKALGLSSLSGDAEDDRGERSVWFGKDAFKLRVRFFNFLSDNPRIDVGMLGPSSGAGRWWLALANGMFEPKTLPQILKKAITVMEKDGARWIADPEAFHAKRR